ncbi:BhlA/UviB family holin-like peptide [Domibacillus epiphyticus]|uniref:Holin n=1 Tax=Domibacillus epiphyticus TaxID=1714355 RepID=A0A1V2A7A0_9BACI|nr:BhlA/UviB family holin-like peptide [Domibacillus epiphyticus]OMP66875.1 holin [Domibacillus epiphyticus]
MDFTQIPPEMWAQPAIFIVLFVYLLRYVMTESKERENRLMVQIEKQNETNEKIVSSLQSLEKDIAEIKAKGE